MSCLYLAAMCDCIRFACEKLYDPSSLTYSYANLLANKSKMCARKYYWGWIFSDRAFMCFLPPCVFLTALKEKTHTKKQTKIQFSQVIAA